MISPSAVKRVKYEQEQSNEFVRLLEYIIFEDDRDNDKYVVFKFKNCVTQWLHELRFIVFEFDDENQLIQKSTISYKETKVKENSSFVPSAKYKANGNMDHITIEIEQAVFERMEFNKGDVKELKFDYSDYKKEVKDEDINATKTGNRKEGYIKPTFFSDDDKKKRSKKITIKNITNANRSFAAPVFAIIMSVIVIAICAFTAVYSKDYPTSFKDANTGIVYTIDYSAKTNSVKVSGYDGSGSGSLTIKKEVTNTATGKKYNVTGIAENAFLNYKNVYTIIFTANVNVKIEQNAFKNCTNLRQVSGTDTSSVTVEGFAFADCTSLVTFNVSGATVKQNCFGGCTNLESVTAYRATVGNPYSLFGANDYESLPKLKKIVYTESGTTPVYQK